MDMDKKEKLDIGFSERIMSECMTDDPERDHEKGDRILCELLEELGFSKVIEAYNEIFKWHA